MTCSLSKILEKIVSQKLLSFFKEKKILSHAQHGFLPMKSVDTNLLEAMDDWTDRLENKKCVDICYFDIAKAFDTVNHYKLLKKLNKVGIHGALLRWITNFLTNRTFSVRLDYEKSDPLPVTSGVPQGSVLGPLLFLFYISDLEDFCKTDGVSLKLYADDLKAYTQFSENDMCQVLQSFINKFSEWCRLNDLTIAANKCSVLYLGSKNPRNQYSLNNTIIPVSDEYVRDLGMFIQPTLKWNFHIKNITKNGYGRLFNLFKSLRSNDPSFLFKMFVAYVRPLLEFSSTIFNPYYKKDIKAIEKVQKTALNIIYYRCLQSKYHDKPSYEELIKMFETKSLQYRRLFTDLVVYHKILLNTIDVKLTSFQLQNPNMYDLRSQTKTEISFAKTNCRFHFFTVKVPKIYAKLPHSATRCNKISSFVTQLKSCDLSPFLS